MIQNQSVNKQSGQDSDVEAEISLLDILRFLKDAYKTIFIFGAFGIAAAIAYLVITPRQYEATAQIAMAQIGTANNSNINPLGVNIEEPSLLVARMSSPTSFTLEVTSACGMESKENAPLALSKSIKLMVLKGVANVVELKTFGKTPQAAQECNLAIFELIKTTQAQIVAPYIADAKIKLDDDMGRLDRAKELAVKADKSGSVMGAAAYLSTRDEIRYLLDEIAALKNIVTSNPNRTTRLIAPIYYSDIPTAPNKSMTLVAGLFGGLFLGLLIALARQVVVKLGIEAWGAL